jgi:hypothetical protein
VDQHVCLGDDDLIKSDIVFNFERLLKMHKPAKVVDLDAPKK